MVIVVMGVAGAGKTTIGEALARALGFRFVDADLFHPRRNVSKMRRGVPLDDVDRAPWLSAIADSIDEWLRDGVDVVLACSALKDAYRARLLRDPARVRFVYLRLTPDLARERLARRMGHFMKSHMVEGQFEVLEEPRDAITLDAALPPEALVRRVRAELGK